MHKKNFITIITVIGVNIFLLMKDTQLWFHLLSPYTKFITLFVIVIFFIITLPKIKLVLKFLKKFLNSKLIYIYILYLFIVFISGPDLSETKNLFYYISFFIYHYVAIVSISLFYFYGSFEKNFKTLIYILFIYVVILSIFTICEWLFIVSEVINLKNWIINYKYFFDSNPPTASVIYYWPYYISIFRSDKIFHFFGLNFYQTFSISSEPGIMALVVIPLFVFMISYNVFFSLVVFFYIIILGSFAGYISLVLIFFFKIFKNYPKIIFIIILLFLSVVIFLIYVYSQKDPYSIIPRIEYLHLHIYVLREIIIQSFHTIKISLLGNGYEQLPGILFIQILKKWGILGLLSFMLFNITLLYTALKYYLKFKGKKFISIFSLAIIIFSLMIFKQAFIYYYYYIFFILSYIFYINIFKKEFNEK